MDRRNRFIQHPKEIPVRLRPAEPPGGPMVAPCPAEQVGVQLHWPQPLKPGSFVELCIPSVKPQFCLHTQVAWCRGEGRNFEVGLALLNGEEAFRLRMIEQLCHIYHYQAQVQRREGRSLNPDQAAREWITQFADDFPPLPTQTADGGGRLV